MPTAPLLDREFLERLERLTIHWQKSFPGLVGGHNMSRFAGSGQEFLDHRNFHHGDDLRAVNWRAYLRLDKLFLKMFQVEPRVPVRLLIDTQRIDDGARRAEVRICAQARRRALLCGAGPPRLDRGAWIFQPADAADLFDRRPPPFHRGDGRHRGVAAGGATDYQALVREFIGTYSQRGLLIIISDFLDDKDCERALQYLSDFGHELMLLQVWTDEDRTPPWTGELELRDAETGTPLKLDFDDDARGALHAGIR